METTPPQKRFPAKLLLFGEHVLLHGATALAVPVSVYGGTWVEDRQTDRFHARMMELAESEPVKGTKGLDYERFKRELEAGLRFESNIPSGYGLGSSGALCAAVYDRYVSAKTNDYAELKQIFARMESFYHGNSSGIDPLTSYTGAGILIRNKTEVEKAECKPWNAAGPIVFLLDSHLPRRSGPLIAWFMEQMEKSAFAQQMETEYLPAHEAAIKHWMQAEGDLFWTALQEISAFQFAHFAPMVPESLRDLWAESLMQDEFSLKICGAGGGGFVLGFARNKKITEALAERFTLIYPFQSDKSLENPVI